MRFVVAVLALYTVSLFKLCGDGIVFVVMLVCLLLCSIGCYMLVVVLFSYVGLAELGFFSF